MTERRTSGGGALEVGDVCLVEDGSERSDAVVSDRRQLVAPIVFESASEGQDGNDETVDVSMGADTKANI